MLFLCSGLCPVFSCSSSSSVEINIGQSPFRYSPYEQPTSNRPGSDSKVGGSPTTADFASFHKMKCLGLSNDAIQEKMIQRGIYEIGATHIQYIVCLFYIYLFLFQYIHYI